MADVRLPPGFQLMPAAQQDPRQGVKLPPGFALIEDMAPEDLSVPGVPGDPAYEARQAEFDRRNKASLAAENNWVSSRDPMTRVADTASFIASAPVRAFTRGEYGAGDLLSGIGLSRAGEAVAGSERDFVRANPEIIQKLGAAGEIAAGIPALNTMGRFAPRQGTAGPVSPNTQAAVMRAAEATEDLGAARRLNVDVPGFAFNDGPVASVAKQLSETPLIGAPARRAIETGITGTARAADEVADAYGDVRTPQQIGQVAEQGLTRFRDARPADVLDASARALPDEKISEVVRTPARDTSLKSKQAVLYERAWRQIPEPMREGRAVEGDARVMANPKATRDLLAQITERNLKMVNQAQASRDGKAVAYPVTGGLLGRIVKDIIESPTQTMSLQTLRNMRSEIRRLASGMPDTEKNTLRVSDLERLQGSITQDMVGLLERNAQRAAQAGNTDLANSFMRSIGMFKRADKFTALSMQRLDTVERMFNAPNAEALARNITQAAMTKGRGNLEALRTLRRTLQGDEMSAISSGIIRELGAPVGSARGVTQQANFSVSSFMTRWQNMTPEARSLLFDGPHRDALDDLVRVANRIANVEALANTSRSGTNSLNVGSLLATGGAVLTGAADVMTAGLGAAGSGFAASVLMSRPEYTKWMVKYLQLRARGSVATERQGPAIAEHIRALALMADDDPDLQQVVMDLAGDNERTQ